MLTEALFVMFIAHFLGDYILTTGDIANGKSSEYRYTFLHCVLYTLIHYAGCIFLGFTAASFILATVISLSHAIVDFCKSYVTINKEACVEKGFTFIGYGRLLYMLDQQIHYFLTFFFCDMFASHLYSDGLITKISPETCVIILFFAIMWQPTYVTYRVLSKTGYLIGNTFEKKDSFIKIVILFVALCYFISPWLVIVLFIGYFMLPSDWKNKVGLQVLCSAIGFSAYAYFWVQFITKF